MRRGAPASLEKAGGEEEDAYHIHLQEMPALPFADRGVALQNLPGVVLKVTCKELQAVN